MATRKPPAEAIQYEGRTLRSMTIGPIQAEEWLSTVNTRNRSVLPKQIDRYARAMKNGRWRPLVGEPISFADDGTLLNGQQRLNAVVKSGTTQVFAVLEGLPLDDQDAMDAGATRKRGQQLVIHGWKNGTQVASIVSVLLKWHTNTILSGLYQPDNDEVVQFAENHKDLVTAATVVAMRVRRTVPLLPSVVGAVYFTACDLATEKPEILQQSFVDDFFLALETGANLGPKDPILTLRNSAAARKRDSIRVEPERELYYLCRVWKATRDGETMERLQLPRQGPITLRHLVIN